MAFTGILLAAGCSDALDPLPGGEEDVKDGYINIKLRSSSLTRAAEAGLDQYNENKIESAVLLLYPDDGTAGSLETYVPAVSQTFTGIDATTTHVLHVVLSESIKNRLFGNDGSKSCRAYVFTNLPQDVLANVNSSTTADAIKKMTVTSPFDANEAPSSFVMDGTGNVTLAADGKSATGLVPVTRAASKITLSIRVPESLTIGEDADAVTWYSQRDNMAASIANGVKTSCVVPSAHTNVDGDYYTMPTQKGQVSGPRDFMLKEGVSADDQTGYPYIVEIPFYSYPNSWTENAEETHKTFITLMVPWREGEQGSFRTSYYQVPVNKSNEIVRNVSYRVCLNVGVLGSFTPDEPFDLDDCSYTAVNWSEEPVDVSISDYRYLVVDADYYVVNNEPSISIPIYTSHPLEVVSVTATYYRYAVTTQGDEFPVTITQTLNQATADYSGNNGRFIWTCKYSPNSSTDANGLLNLNHEMIQWTPYRRNGNRYTAIAQNQLGTYQIAHFRPTENAEYSRYEFLIKVQHIGKEEYSQTIRVVQYPAMYIETSQNYYSAQYVSAAQGNMYVNGNQSTFRDNTYWNYASGLGSSANNRNSNQYVITIGVLDNNRYTIGDARVKTSTNLGISTTTTSTNSRTEWYLAPNYYTNSNTGLNYYYPTNSDSKYDYYVSPKFRIASSYGVCGAISYSNAQKRCASYQEMSRPAGRWRMPTLGELEYIINLSENDYIPTLFNPGGNYWCGQGRISATINSDGHLANSVNRNLNNNTAFVRCVYDEWYWGNDTIAGTGTGAAYQKTYPFTWGDREIDFSQNDTRSADNMKSKKGGAGIMNIIRKK